MVVLKCILFWNIFGCFDMYLVVWTCIWLFWNVFGCFEMYLVVLKCIWLFSEWGEWASLFQGKKRTNWWTVSGEQFPNLDAFLFQHFFLVLVLYIHMCNNLPIWMLSFSTFLLVFRCFTCIQCGNLVLTDMFCPFLMGHLLNAEKYWCCQTFVSFYLC